MNTNTDCICLVWQTANDIGNYAEKYNNDKMITIAMLTVDEARMMKKRTPYLTDPSVEAVKMIPSVSM